MNPRPRLALVLGGLVLTLGLLAAGLQGSLSAVEIGRWGTGQFADKHASWWWNEGKCNSTATLDAQGRKPGAKCLQVVNKTPRAPNHYGTTQQAVAIAAGQQYQITLWARAKGLASDGGVNVAVDEAWRVRPIQLPKGTYDWTRFAGTFSLPADKAQLRILSEDAGEVWIDELRIEPAPQPVAGGAAAAASEPSPDPRGDAEDAVWATASGGIARTKDAAVAIPPGAAKRGFRFRLHRGPGDEPNLDPNLQVLDVRAAIEAPDAPPLDKPARVTLSFDGKLPAGVDAKRIVPLVHNGLFWEKVYSAKIDPSAQTASFDVPWLGTAAIALDRFETMLVRHHEWEKLLEMEGAPYFIVEYAAGTPASPDREYLDVILATLYRCHDVFVRELKYDPPSLSPIVVRVCDLNAEQIMKAMDRRYRVMGMASLAGFHREIAGGVGQILITSTLRDGNALRAAVAHEYFHLLQAAALRRNNVPLERVKDAMVRDLQWFTEASADWGADVVFDELDPYAPNLATERDYTFKGIIQSSVGGAPISHVYAGACFVKFLSWRYGKDFVRQAWRLADTGVKRNGRPEKLETTFDVLSAACNGAKTLDGKHVDLPTNAAAFAVYFNFYRNLGESQWWFRDKGSNRWLLDSPPHMKRVALKDRRKGSLALGVVKPLGTGPLLRLDHDKAKPLNVTLRLKPYAGYSARDDAGMVAVVFADEQRIVRAQPMNGAGGTIRVPAKTASHLVVVPLNVHGYREFPMTLEWARPRESREGVFVRGPVRILHQTLRPDVKCTLSVNGNSATVVFVDPKTGRKEWSTFQWDVPPEKLRLEERFALVLRGSHRVEPKPKPAPAPPRPIEDNRTFRAGTPERPIILNGKDQGSPEGVLWFCTGRMFLPVPAQTIGPSAADLRSYLSNVLNFSSAPSFGLKEPRPKVHPGRFSLSPDVTCSRIILPPQPRRYEQLFSAEDEGASRVGIYITGEQENRLGFAAVIFWDYTELESAVAGPGT